MTAERGGYERIEGYFGAREAELYRQQVRRASPPARFVEIGSWMGRSSLCMAEAIRDSGKDIEFWCVDTWGGSDEHTDVPAVQEGRLLEEFEANVEPVRKYLTPLPLASVEAANHFDEASLDFVFIDAAHDFHNVLADIRAWQGKVKPQGVLAGHDYDPAWPGVVQAVEAAFGRSARAYGGCWYYAPGVTDAVPWTLHSLRWNLRWATRRRLQPDLFRLPGASTT